MLTADLLQIRQRRGTIEPRSIAASDEALLARAELILAVFDGATGLRRGALTAQLNELSEQSPHARLDAGLKKLCFDRARFTVQSVADPVELRRQLFGASAAARRATGNIDRSAIIADAAARHELPEEAIEEGLYADLKDNERLESFRKLSARALLERYNLALAQGILLKATQLDIQLSDSDPGRCRRLFRALKFHRLLHRVQARSEGGYQVTIDGPMSLFSLSTQYGMRMAQLLPTLLLCEDWKLDAALLWGPRRSARRFRLDSSCELKSHLRDTGARIPEELESFSRQWPEDSRWRLERSSEIIDLGGEGVLIPDFVFRYKRSKVRRVYLEVLGYWNKGSLERRLELLRRHGPEQLILAISRSLCVDRDGVTKVDLEALPGALTIFRTTPNRRELAKLLEAWQPKPRGQAKTKGKRKRKSKRATKPKVTPKPKTASAPGAAAKPESQPRGEV